MSTAIPSFRDIFLPRRDEAGRPCAVGAIRFGSYTAHLFACLLCDDGFAALLFGSGSKTQLDAIWAACVTGGKKVELALDRPLRRLIPLKRLPDPEGYERFDHDDLLSLSNGRPLLLVSRTVLTDYLANPPDTTTRHATSEQQQDAPQGAVRRFITFGPPGANEPYAFWLTQLRQIILLPEQPGWAEIVWREAVKHTASPSSLREAGRTARRANGCPLIAPITDSVGLAPAWRVLADPQAWRDLYSHLARKKKLPVADGSVIAPNVPAHVAWSLKGYRAWTRS
jgi:hypothetical protein